MTLLAGEACIVVAGILGAVSWSAWGQRLPQRTCFAAVVALFLCGCVFGMVSIR